MRFIIITGVFISQVLVLIWNGIYQRKELELKLPFINKIQTNRVKWGNFFVIFNVQKVFASHMMTSHNTSSKHLSNDVTLVTQLSNDRLGDLSDIIKRWNGKISIAILVKTSGDLTHTIQSIILINHCFRLTDDVQFHIVFANHIKPGDDVTSIENWHQFFVDKNQNKCLNLNQILKKVVEDKKQHCKKSQLVYPHNTMRNVARHAVVTSHLLVLDADIIPSSNIRSEFFRVSNLSDKMILIIPAFEMKLESKMPNSKKSLLLMKDRGEIQIFHQQTCPMCHKPTK